LHVFVHGDGYIMPNVLFVYHDSSFGSGASSSMTDILINFIRNDFDSFSVLHPSRKGDLSAALKKYGIPCLSTKYYPSRFSKKNNLLACFYPWLKCLFKTFYSFISALIFVVSGRANPFDIIYANTTDNYMAYFIARLSRKKLIWHVREFGLEDQNALHVFGIRFFYKKIVSSSAYVFFISNSLGDFIRNYNNSLNMHLFYDDLIIDTDVNNYSESNLFKMLVVGTISIGKGQYRCIDLVKEANARNVRIEIGIIGSTQSDYAAGLIENVKVNGFSNIIKFLGYKNKKELSEIRKNYPYGLVLSTKEAFGRITVEGMSCGQIMLVTNSGANSELVRNEHNGICFENFPELLDKLSGLNDSDKVDKIRFNATKSSNEFTSGKSSLKILSLILECK